MFMFEQIIRIFAPFVCLGCGIEEDTLLCGACMQTMAPVPSRCYRCRAVSHDFETCRSCRRTSPLTAVYVARHYDGLARSLVRTVKYERAQAGVASMCEAAAPLLACIPQDAILVPVPTASGRVRQRGYDQSQLFARSLRLVSRLRSGRLLSRIGQAHQVGSGRAERLKHLEGAFRVVRPDLVAGAHLVLVDDVVTTGATLEAAARSLRAAGARRVDAVVFAQAG